VPANLRFKSESWTEFKEQIRAVRHDDLVFEIKKLARQMKDAANAIKDENLLAKLAAAQEKLDDAKFDESCQRVLRRWQTLSSGNDPRSVILAMQPAAFNQDYHTSAGYNDTFLAIWADLPHAALRCLAVDAKKEIDDTLRTLEGLGNRFPLSCPPNILDSVSDSNELNPKEVDQARELVLRLLGNESFGQESLARAQAIDPDCEEQIKNIRPSGVLSDQQLRQYQAMRAVLLALPTADRPIRVAVTATKRSWEGKSLWQHAGLRQGDRPLNDVTLWNSPNEENMGEIDFPGGPLTIEFGTFNKNRKLGEGVAQKYTIGDPKRQDQWALLRLLLAPNVTMLPPDPKNPKQFECVFGITVDPNNQNKGAWLTLRFQLDGPENVGKLPSREEWTRGKSAAAAPPMPAAGTQ
jgi:hypothetical protein